MRPVREYTAFLSDRPVDSLVFIARAHDLAARRAARVAPGEELVASTVDSLLAEGGHDHLLLGRVDPEGWAARERIADEVVRRIRDAFPATRLPATELVADHVALHLDARFPALSDGFQPLVERLERDWGFSRDLWVDVTLPDSPAIGTAFGAFVRQSTWDAERVADGRATGLTPQDDSRATRLPHSIVLHRLRGEVLAELWMWPAADAEGGWVHTWLALQDDTRLVPFHTAQVAPQLIDVGFLTSLDAFVAGAAAWWHELAARRRAIAHRHDLRDGIPPLGMPRA